MLKPFQKLLLITKLYNRTTIELLIIKLKSKSENK